MSNRNGTKERVMGSIAQLLACVAEPKGKEELSAVMDAIRRESEEPGSTNGEFDSEPVEQSFSVACDEDVSTEDATPYRIAVNALRAIADYGKDSPNALWIRTCHQDVIKIAGQALREMGEL